ncbi:alpha/beta hydrolase [Streptomyces mirabilis]|uniref:alpha/beta hydrolase n=1 Tax=Streptomyces mirabilis TaxID=68239 RepID=UPI0036502506
MHCAVPPNRDTFDRGELHPNLLRTPRCARRAGRTPAARYVPDRTSGPVPVVIMSHGMADSADRLADNGFGVILYDHRGFGPSDGEPRQEFAPIAQCRDMQMAITFAQSCSAFDADRVALWGTIFSGGHVLAVAAIDTRVRAVVSQAPWIAGTEIARDILGSEGLAAFWEVFNAERRTLLGGGRPSLSPVVRHPAALRGSSGTSR